MVDTPRDEQLSAFIDGELTDAERADVEKLLAENADARQLVSELKALKQSVGSLPSYQLEENLAKRVLQRAERAMLTDPVGDAATDDVTATEKLPATSEAAAPLSRPPLRERLSHVYLWPVLAVAAAILIMVFLPDRDAQIAKVDEQRLPGESAQAPRDEDKPNAGRASTLSAGAESAADYAGESLEPMPDVAAEMERPLAPPQGLAAQPGAAGAADESRSALRSRRDMARIADLPAEDAASPVLEEKVEASYAFQEADRLAGELLIVRVDVDESMMRVGALATLFSRQGLAIDAAVPRQETETPAAADGKKDDDKERESSNARAVQDAQATEDVELIYVEATADELKETLAALAANGNRYANVTLEPAAAVETQRELLTWYRGRGGEGTRESGFALEENEDSEPNESARTKAAPSGRSPSGVVTGKKGISRESRREGFADSAAASDLAKTAMSEAKPDSLLGSKGQLGRAELAQIVASQARTPRTTEDAAAGGGAGGIASRAQRLILPGLESERRTATEGGREELRLLYKNARRDEAAADKRPQADAQRAAETVEKGEPSEPPAEKRDQRRAEGESPLVQTLFVFRRATPAAEVPPAADDSESPTSPDR